MDLSNVSLDTTAIASGGLIVIGALAAIWAIKETISLFRSRK